MYQELIREELEQLNGRVKRIVDDQTLHDDEFHEATHHFPHEEILTNVALQDMNIVEGNDHVDHNVAAEGGNSVEGNGHVEGGTRQSLRVSHPPIWMKDYMKQVSDLNPLYTIGNYVSYQHISPSYAAYLSKFSTEVEPRSYKERGSKLVIILLYVDGLLITKDDANLIEETQCVLHSHFKNKDLGELKYFLGIEFLRSNKGMMMNQRKYALELISEQPKASHWNAASRVVRYVKGDPGKGLLLSSDHKPQLTGFCDADWAACANTKRSVTSFILKFGDSQIS
uniref:Reverse transcriptase Ty1/copia-type domain-containing protein n=1 Tax=Solanum lycopersicum TaxID=4081 RepID=A0A3Q7G4E5_SOLLC